MSAIEDHPERKGLIVVAPDAARGSAKPLPSEQDLVIDGLTDEEWDAFEAVLRFA